MTQAKHCDLCEYPKRDMKNGLTCGLTDKKPDFKGFCSDIKFSDSFKEYLPELLNNIEEQKKIKIAIYLNSCFFGAIGLLLIFGSYSYLTQSMSQIFEPEFSYRNWKYFSGILLLNFVGFLLISMGFKPLYKHRKSLQKLASSKKEIDTVLKNYGVEMKALMKIK